jgi:hypothetical protein
MDEIVVLREQVKVNPYMPAESRRAIVDAVRDLCAWPGLLATAYPSKPVEPMSRWLVRMVVDSSGLVDPWKHDVHLWAYSSTDAVLRARADFYGTWATAADRERLPLRVLEVLQEGV